MNLFLQSKTIELFNILVSKVDFYLIQCNMDIEAAYVAYEELNL